MAEPLVLQIGDQKLELELPPEVQQEHAMLADHEKMLGMQIAWSSYGDAGHLTSTEVEMMRQYATKAVEVRLELFRQKSQQYAELFMKILTDIVTPATVQYLLTLLDDLLRTDERTAAVFLRLRSLRPELPVGMLIRLLHQYKGQDLYTFFKVFRVLSILLIKDTNPHPDEVQYLMKRLIQQLQQTKATEVNIGVLCLMQLLRRDAYRTVFMREHGLEALVMRLNTPNVSSQALYQLIYCTWLATFNADVAGSLDTTELIPRLVDALKNTPKEKVQRITLATLRNCADKGRNNELMIEAGAMRVINGLAGKKWGDDDIVEDIEVMREALQKNLVVMSSFDAYKKEVTSGHLQWSPVHKSERFWRENCMRFEEADFHVLRMLLEHLQSADPLHLAVACHDVGEFVRFHPRGKQLIADMGAKVSLMSLMSSNHPDVQKEALLATQKLLVANYTFLTAAETKQAKSKEAAAATPK